MVQHLIPSMPQSKLYECSIEISPKYDPIAIPVLNAAILIADATSTAVGTCLSANVTTYIYNPGTFINVINPIKKMVIIDT